jgi:hypothetical protein
MSLQVVFIIIGVIFYLIRQYSKMKEDQAAPNQKSSKRNTTAEPSSSRKSIDDIFGQFVKEVQRSKNKEVKPVQMTQKKPVEKKPALDWQRVSRSKLVTKKQLINDDFYQNVQNKEGDDNQIQSIADIQSTEGKVFDFNFEEIDLQKAVIYKEILDRRYA